MVRTMTITMWTQRSSSCVPMWAVSVALSVSVAQGWVNSNRVGRTSSWLPISYTARQRLLPLSTVFSSPSSVDDAAAATSSSPSSAALSIFTKTLKDLTRSSSDIRGRFVSHGTSSNLESVADAIRAAPTDGIPALTPLSAYCLGRALAEELTEKILTDNESDRLLKIGIGLDPRWHGTLLANALAQGAESFKNEAADTSNSKQVQVFFNTAVCTTPAMESFCRMKKCQAAVMVTASHLPGDRNGFKFYLSDPEKPCVSGFSKADVRSLGDRAVTFAEQMNPTLPQLILECSQTAQQQPVDVQCAVHVDWMPEYAASLKDAILAKTKNVVRHPEKPLEGLKLVLNSGNGSGGFFAQVLTDLGADTSGSQHLEPDGSFPNGIPNPEDAAMLKQTIAACENAQADLGIMFDTDGDRSGFVVPRSIQDDGTKKDYEALNRNRLIALLGVVFSREHPGCIIVTDSVTSEGLASFLQDQLGLQHVRFKKGYANVINKAMEINADPSVDASAEVAIETSGHCAMRENDFLDDGTYTAVQVVSLLAREKESNNDVSLLELIQDMDELEEASELRLSPVDQSLDRMRHIFDIAEKEIERQCQNDTSSWKLDTENLEGIRVRVGGTAGQFFMIRKSLHDPIISVQIEAASKEEGRDRIVGPLLELFESIEEIKETLDTSVLQSY